MAKLSIRSVVKQFGSFTAVEDFTLDLDAGKFLALLGPSGCGKTTMLRTIAGFEQPTGGTIHLDGRLLSSATLNIPPERRNMSMIFQSYAIWPNMTVAQNVGFGLKIRKVDAAAARQKVGRMLEMVRLAPLADRYPAELSGGQQQRVALARALVIDPEVLLLDEPLSNLDASLRDEMRGEIRRIHDALQTTSIYVTHDQGEAIATADTIVVMNRGRIEQIGPPDRIFDFPETRFVAEFIGRANVLSGKVNGAAVDFAGFSIPTAALPPIAGPTVACALRAHTITLHHRPIVAEPPAIVIPGRVTGRTYYGEYRSFQVQPERGAGEKPLLVFCGPAEDAEIGSQVHLRIDAAKLVVLRGD
jgi:ABC-type Fe3+/spermidine/putrescine transport system ATPase subunit